MKERPILFSAPMVRAILDGSKTQTRRIVKPQPEMVTDKAIKPWEGDPAVLLQMLNKAGRHCRYGQPGARLWVRETFFAFGRWETRYSEKKKRDEWHFIDMTLETGRAYLFEDPAAGKSKRSSVTPTWWKRPAIHMPRRASRILLEVTGVRVERLQDISEADATLEGVEADVFDQTVGFRNYSEKDGWFIDWPGFVPDRAARESYRTLWESINGAGSWDANPWVWIVEFSRIDALKQAA